MHVSNAAVPGKLVSTKHILATSRVSTVLVEPGDRRNYRFVTRHICKSLVLKPGLAEGWTRGVQLLGQLSLHMAGRPSVIIVDFYVYVVGCVLVMCFLNNTMSSYMRGARGGRAPARPMLFPRAHT